MSIMQMKRPARMAVVLVASAGLLTGCAQGQFSTREARIGPDDGSDSCRPQLVALDSTGNFFGADILAGAGIGAATGAVAGGLIGRDWRGALIGAAIGGALGAAGGYLHAVQQRNADQAAMMAQVRGDLSRENAEIDRTQLALDQLNDCRAMQAQRIRSDYAAGRIDRGYAIAAMTGVKRRAERDVALARQINQQIQGRSQELVVAADSISPGTKNALAAQTGAPRDSVLRQEVKLRMSPDPSSPEVGTVPARQMVKVTGARNGYAVVQTPTGQRGYVPAAAVDPAAVRAAAPAAGAAGTQDVRTLAGSNAARRDSFAQSVQVSEAAASGYELAG
jgi:hypothetical protein